MRTRPGLIVSSIAIALMLGGAAVAQQSRTATPAQQAQPQLNQKDMKFVKEAAMGGMAEVELGKLAEQKGQSDQVKQFGARMVRDHGAAGNELAMVASGKGVALPQQLDQKYVQMRDRLATLRGAEFDRAYMHEMVADHDKDMKAFREHAQSGSDADIKAFAQKMLPTIETHDRMAHDIVKSMATTGSSRPTQTR